MLQHARLLSAPLLALDGLLAAPDPELAEQLDLRVGHPRPESHIGLELRGSSASSIIVHPRTRLSNTYLRADPGPRPMCLSLQRPPSRSVRSRIERKPGWPGYQALGLRPGDLGILRHEPSLLGKPT